MTEEEEKVADGGRGEVKSETGRRRLVTRPLSKASSGLMISHEELGHVRSEDNNARRLCNMVPYRLSWALHNILPVSSIPPMLPQLMRLFYLIMSKSPSTQSSPSTTATLDTSNPCSNLSLGLTRHHSMNFIPSPLALTSCRDIISIDDYRLRCCLFSPEVCRKQASPQQLYQSHAVSGQG